MYICRLKTGHGMKPLKAYNIPFVGLKLGKHRFEYQIDKKFFEYFEYDDFNDIAIDVDLVFDKKTTLMELDFKIKGTANVNCDTTDEPYEQPLGGSFHLIVKFGEAYNDENEDILIIPHGEHEINVAQYIYELIVLSMPIKREHPGIADGTLQSDILKRLEELRPQGNHKENEEDIDPRWNTLKKLLTDK